ncbi:MAG: hypothetical protein IT364_02930 [Candidatus Hydrogenedentes bacterium]|nr:hypothetical protein [Candidatus Hydrogenedentota bacterium]
MNAGGSVYGSLEDALKAVVGKLGGAKLVAGRLWPEAVTDVDALAKAQQKLLHCLDRGRQEKLSLSELSAILRMAREINAWDVVEHLSSTLGFRFEPITREELLTARVAELEALLRQTVNVLQRSPVLSSLDLDKTLDNGVKP